jgi:hypothetical protein
MSIYSRPRNLVSKFEVESEIRAAKLMEQNFLLIKALRDIIVMAEEHRIFDIIERAKAEIAKAQEGKI